MSDKLVARIAMLTLLSWSGFYIHTTADLPQLTWWSPENSVPTLIYIVLFLAWWLSSRLPFKRVTTAVLLGWTLLHLVGGSIISVLPLQILPFDPAQTLFHYSMHILYGLAQLPLIVVLARQLRSSSEPDSAAAADYHE